MKTFFYKILFVLLMLLCTFPIKISYSAENQYLVPLFENISDRKKNTTYHISITDPKSPQNKIPIRMNIDQYSETARAIVENNLVNRGCQVIERLRMDQIVNQLKWPQKNGFINKKYALELGKMVGANRIVMGTILSMNYIRNKITAYGANTEVISIICKTRIRLIDIRSSKVIYSDISKGQVDLLSSEFNQTTASDTFSSSIEASVEQLVSSERFQQVTICKP